MTGRVESITAVSVAWLLRAGWVAQELLTTSTRSLPRRRADPGVGGTFVVPLDGETIFSRREAGRFPEMKELKQSIRDLSRPGRPLGIAIAREAAERCPHFRWITGRISCVGSR